MTATEKGEISWHQVAYETDPSYKLLIGTVTDILQRCMKV